MKMQAVSLSEKTISRESCWQSNALKLLLWSLSSHLFNGNSPKKPDKAWEDPWSTSGAGI